MEGYEEFLAAKAKRDIPTGHDFEPPEWLFPFQRTIVKWAIGRGRAAIFADTGLGKTAMQLAWAAEVSMAEQRPVLILAPLAVAQQTQREGAKFGIPVTVCRRGTDIQPGVNVSNYEMLGHFDPAVFAGVVLDESSILKAFGGTYRKEITAFASGIDYRLSCTATPAPNDLIEITNQAEFLGVMQGKEIVALYFTQDGNSTHKWRLKGHAKKEFWQWMAQWCVACRRPSDVGGDDEGFNLPPLTVEQIDVKAPNASETLFPMEAVTMPERLAARRNSVDERVAVVADLVQSKGGRWIVWCNLNKESEGVRRAIEGAVEVRGSDTSEHKERSLLDFADGKIDVLVTKPSIAGFGMNFQSCHQMAFVGLSDSYEQFYQAVRRCWRFGQKSPVNAYAVVAETEGRVADNIKRKEREASKMMDNIVGHIQDIQLDRMARNEMEYTEETAEGDGWKLMLGDSVLRAKEIESESVGLTVFSPPFPGMYTYTNSRHDVGNTETIDQMIDQYRYLVPELLRVTMPGRMCCVHLMQLTAMKSREGYIGIKDYRGRMIQAMEEGGWRYAGEVTIDKNPQIQATRNKERGLLFKSLATDSAMMRMAMADYLIYFRKDGINPRPIRAGMSEKYNHGDGWISEAEWIEWAAPVWYRQTKNYPGGIRETEVLNVSQARETDDERHLCPLQLGVIERAVKLWSAPGDLVFSPFAGIGSEGVESVRNGREFVGIELKRSYWESAVRNMRTKAIRAQTDLFRSA